MTRLLFTTLLPALFIPWAALGNPGISVTSSVDRSTITVGDRIRYRIDVSHPQGTSVEMPGLGVHLGNFEVKDYKVGEPHKGKDGRIHVSYEYVISTFTVGDYTIPPIPIACRNKDGVLSRMLTDKIDIQVESVKPSEAGDIKDIKPPVSVRGGLDWYWWTVIGVAALGLLIFLAVRLLRRKKKNAATPPPRPPYDVALDSLEALLSRQLLEQGLVREFHFRLSEILRTYLGDRFRFNAIDRTSLELYHWLDTATLASDADENIRGFCEENDLVKFADRIPAPPENEKMLRQVRDILMVTRPSEPGRAPADAPMPATGENQ